MGKTEEKEVFSPPAPPKISKKREEYLKTLKIQNNPQNNEQNNEQNKYSNGELLIDGILNGKIKSNTKDASNSGEDASNPGEDASNSGNISANTNETPSDAEISKLNIYGNHSVNKPYGISNFFTENKRTETGGKRRSRKRNQKKSKKNHKKRNPRKSRRHRR